MDSCGMQDITSCICPSNSFKFLVWYIWYSRFSHLTNPREKSRIVSSKNYFSITLYNCRFLKYESFYIFIKPISVVGWLVNSTIFCITFDNSRRLLVISWYLYIYFLQRFTSTYNKRLHPVLSIFSYYFVFYYAKGYNIDKARIWTRLKESTFHAGGRHAAQAFG